MTHTYNVTGMTCSGCEAKVKNLLSHVPGVDSVSIDLAKGTAKVGMQVHVATGDLQAVLKDYPKYRLTEADVIAPSNDTPVSWVKTYKPILLILGYILGGTLLIEYVSGGFVPMRWMTHFMAVFFLVFSFFKLLDLRAFADSYSSYDIVAGRWRAWGLIYPFCELALGLLFLTGFQPVATNAATLLIMGVSIIGVVRSVLSRRPIRCACLGAVFNLPMSTVTIIEDGLMIAMSAYGLVTGIIGF